MDLNINYSELAKEIATHIVLQSPTADTLWNTEEAADYLRQSRRNFVDRISKHPTFPAPAKLPTKDGSVSRCWYAVEIIEWARATKA